MLFRMAWRNLWRNKRRTAITLASVALGVWLATTFMGIGEYSYSNMLETGARMGYGHLTVQPSGYVDAPGLDKTLPNAGELREELARSGEIQRALVRITGQGMFATASKSVGGGFFAIDPARESPEDNLFVRSIVEGELFDETDTRGIVVGRVMAEKLNLRLGKRVVFTFVDKQGEIVSEVARVTGIFETGEQEVDGSLTLLPIDLIRRMLGYGPGEATMVVAFLEDHRQADEARRALQAAMSGEGRELLTWRDTQPELAGIIAMDRSMNYIFQILIGLLIGAGVFNTILMSVLERRREFGVMMAVGTRPRDLFGLVVIESVLVGVVGLVVGAALTLPWYVFMSRTGIDVSQMYGETSVNGVLVEPVLKLLLYPTSVVAVLCAVLVLTVLAGLYPAFQAGREPPVETLKAL